MPNAFVFPGQGAQFVGMGRDLADRYPSVRRIFDEADEAMGQSLSRICFEGPEEELKRTQNAQPGILVASVAAFQAAKEEQLFDEGAAYVAGHSLGEYTALAAVGAVSIGEAVRLVRLRGEAMQSAGDRTPSTMAAIIALDLEIVETICEECGAEIANYNCPGQLVISGPVDNVRKAMDQAKAKGARSVVELSVSAAFHSKVMEPAAAQMAPIIDGATIRDAAPPIVANVTATPISGAGEIREELKAQITRPVRWDDSIRFLADQGVDRYVEFGPGKVLTSLIKRILGRVEMVNVSDVASLTKLGAGVE